MKSKRMLLLRTLLDSTNSMNVLKHSTDKKKRANIYGAYVGYGLIYLMLAAYCILMTIGMTRIGLAEHIPNMCAVLISLFSLVFTILKTNGYLFGFKEYDMLMAMPFEIRDIIAAKFLYMYIKSIPLMALISLSLLVGYEIGTGFSVLTILLWIVLTVLLPVVPMLIASSLGALIVKIGAGFKQKKIVQTILTFVIIIPTFFMNAIIQNIAKNNKVDEVVGSMTNGIDSFGKFIPTAKWFSDAIVERSILAIVLSIAVALTLLEIFIRVVSVSYRRLNSKLSQGTAHKAYKMKEQKKKNMVLSVAFKEFKRMTGSTIYLTNVGMGVVMVLIISVAVLFFKAERIIELVTNGAPLTPDIVLPAVPVLIYFFLGMMPSTSCSPSLEGKNYWIMKSLPIDPMVDAKGKILFNLILNIPVGVLSCMAFAFCFRTTILNAVLMAVLECVLVLFSSVYGLRCGLKHRRLDWENEVEVVKQGTATTVYLLPNMFASMILMPAVCFYYAWCKNMFIVLASVTAVYLLLTAIAYNGIKKYA